MRTLVAAGVAGLILVSLSQAQSSEASIKKSVNIGAQELSAALHQFAGDRALYLIYDDGDVVNHRTAGATGEMSQNEVLRELLKDSGLTYQYLDEKTVMVVPLAPAPQNSSTPETVKSSAAEAKRSFWERLRLAQADQANAPREEAENSQLEEIVVTATKRNEKLQETPLSITAIGDAEINRKDLGGMEDYLAFVPGVNFFTARGVNNLVIRGISANPDRDPSGYSVGAYFGEVPMAGLSYAGGTSDLRLVDMERVEVLRGPQGTLFGAGSLSGTVRNIPVEPNLGEVEGQVAVGFSNTADHGSDNSKVEGVINLPIINDVLAVRAVAYRHRDSGFVDNVAANSPTFVSNAAFWGVDPSLVANERGVGEAISTGGRLSVLWRATDRLKVAMLLATQDSEEEGSIDVGADDGDFAQTRFQFFSIDGIQRGKEGGKNGIDIGNLLIQYDLSVGNLLSSSSWVSTDGVRVDDLTEFLGGFPAVQEYVPDADSFSQEIRFVSAFGGPLQVLSGLYYENLDIATLSKAYVIGDITHPFNFLGAPFGADTQHVATFDNSLSLKQRAAFGEVSYDLSKRLQLTLGGRWFKYDRSGRARELWVFADTDVTVDAEESGANYKASVEFKASDTAFLYAQWSEGFRFGNAQRAAPTDICDVDGNGILDSTSVPIRDRYDSDFLENFEVGGKFQFFDGKMQLNASVYQMNWDGIPISVQARTPTCAYSQIDNAGKAVSKGFEVESVHQLTPRFRVNVSGSYVKAELEEDAPTLGGRAGDRLPGSPKFNIGAGMQYDFELMGKSAYVRGDYSYVDGFHNNLQQIGLELGDYARLDLAAGIRLNKYNVQLVGRNVANDDGATWRSVNNLQTYRLRPRTIGINVDYQF